MEDLIASRDKILNAIDEMDEVMKRQFKEMFDKINAELNDTFRTLFGGGKAKLILEDQTVTGHPIDISFHGELRADQKDAVQAMMKYDMGILKAVPGFGKTGSHTTGLTAPPEHRPDG